MEKAELVHALCELKDDDDLERSHDKADHLLVDFINDPEVTKAYFDLNRQCA